MRESRLYGSVRGALSNERPYRDRFARNDGERPRAPMIDHVSLAVSDLQRAVPFYERAFAPLGISKLVTRPARFRKNLSGSVDQLAQRNAAPAAG
jgi:hypothetical protein